MERASRHRLSVGAIGRTSHNLDRVHNATAQPFTRGGHVHRGSRRSAMVVAQQPTHALAAQHRARRRLVVVGGSDQRIAKTLMISFGEVQAPVTLPLNTKRNRSITSGTRCVAATSWSEA
jgi:hypothetical protein